MPPMTCDHTVMAHCLFLGGHQSASSPNNTDEQAGGTGWVQGKYLLLNKPSIVKHVSYLTARYVTLYLNMNMQHLYWRLT